MLTEYFEEDTWPNRFASDPDVAGAWDPWFFFVAGIWLIALVIHALRTYLGPPVGPIGRHIRRPVAQDELDRESQATGKADLMNDRTAEAHGKRGALLSEASDEFRVALPPEPAWWACREAVVRLGWEVESIEPDRLVMRRSWWGFARDPAKIEARLSETAPDTTTIVLNGRIRWWGKRQLDGEMKRLRNAIEVAAHTHPERR